MYFDSVLSAVRLKAPIKEKRISNPVTIQIVITRRPEKTVPPPTPSIGFIPNMPAIPFPDRTEGLPGLGDDEEHRIYRQQSEKAGNGYITEVAEKSLHMFVLQGVRVGIARLRSFDGQRGCSFAVTNFLPVACAEGRRSNIDL